MILLMLLIYVGGTNICRPWEGSTNIILNYFVNNIIKKEKKRYKFICTVDI